MQDPLDDGFHYPDLYVRNTWMHYEKTGQFPDGGCYNDQPVTLLQDWATLDKRYAEIYDHCKDLDPEDVWLPPSMAELTPEEVEDEEPVSLFARLKGGLLP